MAKLRQTAATALNVASPKGISKKSSKAGELKKEGSCNDVHKVEILNQQSLNLTRRRLSVVSDNKLVEGLGDLHTAVVPTRGTPRRRSSLCMNILENNIVSHYAGTSKKGFAPYNPKKKNQDALIMVPDEATSSFLFAVFDGHGEAGDAVAGYFESNFPVELFGHPGFLLGTSKGIKSAIIDTFTKLESDIIANKKVDTEFSGTTAVVSIIRGTELIVANIGDSRLTRGYRVKPAGSLIASPVSLDHKPENPEEKARIIATGGRVYALEYDDGIDGPSRVWLGNMDVPGLAMSRSLGDQVAHTAGVSSEPEFYHQTLTPEDECLVLATDGLWEFMSNDEVFQMIDAHQDYKTHDLKSTVDALITEASGRWMKEEQVIDDTTVVLVALKHSHT